MLAYKKNSNLPHSYTYPVLINIFLAPTSCFIHIADAFIFIFAKVICHFFHSFNQLLLFLDFDVICHETIARIYACMLFLVSLALHRCKCNETKHTNSNKS